MVGSLAHLDATSGWATAWGLHGIYAVLGAIVGVVGSALAALVAVQMGPGRGWTRIVGLALAIGLTVTGLVLPGLILVFCLLQPDVGEWLDSPARS